MNNLSDRINVQSIHTHSLQDVSQYLHIPIKNIQSWAILFGYTAKERSHLPIPSVNYSIRDSYLLSFNNIVEAHIIQAIHSTTKVRVDEIRNALNIVGEQLDIKEYPLLNQRFSVNGVKIFVENYVRSISANNDTQDRLKLALDNHLSRIEFDRDGLPSKLYPIRPNSVNSPKIVSIDPTIAFGSLVINGTGITTSILKE